MQASTSKVLGRFGLLDPIKILVDASHQASQHPLVQLKLEHAITHVHLQIILEQSATVSNGVVSFAEGFQHVDFKQWHDNSLDRIAKAMGVAREWMR